MFFKTMVINKPFPFVFDHRGLDLVEGRVIRLGKPFRLGMASRVDTFAQTVAVGPSPWDLPVIRAPRRTLHGALRPMVSERLAATSLFAAGAAGVNNALLSSLICDCLDRTCVAFATGPDHLAVLVAIHEP